MDVTCLSCSSSSIQGTEGKQQSVRGVIGALSTYSFTKFINQVSSYHYLANNYKSSAVPEMSDRGHNRHQLKKGGGKGGAMPLSRRAGTRSNTMWPGPRSTSVPSGVFTQPAVWP